MPKQHLLTKAQIENFNQRLTERVAGPSRIVKRFNGFKKDPPWFLFRDAGGHMTNIHLGRRASGAVRVYVNHYDLGAPNPKAYDKFRSELECLPTRAPAHLELTVLPDELEAFATWVVDVVESVCALDHDMSLPPPPVALIAGPGWPRNGGLPDYAHSRAAWMLARGLSDDQPLALPDWADPKNCSGGPSPQSHAP